MQIGRLGRGALCSDTYKENISALAWASVYGIALLCLGLGIWIFKQDEMLQQTQFIKNILI